MVQLLVPFKDILCLLYYLIKIFFILDFTLSVLQKVKLFENINKKEPT